ncbi:splicing factor 3B subunit 2-like [Pyrgilauda ruficollis]|uniref:splicing factor 3B subunit 2-like n=1 Tax=Pyrgilauda ruficollis TaxID=221976 RepID=UPI001B882792|nr:splicing factor 3B subunit 2-like [Pyrgilauda ruficollis]
METELRASASASEAEEDTGTSKKERNRKRRNRKKKKRGRGGAREGPPTPPPPRGDPEPPAGDAPEVEIEYVSEEPEIYDPNFVFFKRIFEAFKVTLRGGGGTFGCQGHPWVLRGHSWVPRVTPVSPLGAADPCPLFSDSVPSP